MELNLLELFGDPPPFAIGLLLAGLAAIAAGWVRRLCRGSQRVALALDDEP